MVGPVIERHEHFCYQHNTKVHDAALESPLDVDLTSLASLTFHSPDDGAVELPLGVDLTALASLTFHCAESPDGVPMEVFAVVDLRGLPSLAFRCADHNADVGDDAVNGCMWEIHSVACDGTAA
jgi:hypothetical protein